MLGKFKNIISSNRPVIVDFYADWCVPCKQIPPILKQVKEEFKEQVRIIKVDVDRNPHLASQYQIRSIPTIILFKNGQAQWTGQGVRPAQEIKMMVQAQLDN